MQDQTRQVYIEELDKVVYQDDCALNSAKKKAIVGLANLRACRLDVNNTKDAMV